MSKLEATATNGTAERSTPGDGAPKQTNIDRRGATRQVPLEVLCLGLSRTGTNCELPVLCTCS